LDSIPRPFDRLVSDWRSTAIVSLLGLVIGLGCLLAVYAGSVAIDLRPWGALALAAGIGCGAVLRWGAHCLFGAATGTLIGLVGVGMAPAQALAATMVLTLAVWLAAAALQRTGFDMRLSRSRDLALLVGAAAGPLALSAAGGVSLSVLPGDITIGGLALAWLVLLLGGLATALPTLVVDRRLLHALQPKSDWPESLLALAATLAMLWLLAVAPSLQQAPTLVVLSVFAPLLLVGALALRGRVALASCAALLSGLMVAGAGGNGVVLWGANITSGSAQLVWAAALLGTMLLAHGAHADARARAQRWEWALDGSRLGVADWHLVRDSRYASTAWRQISGHGGGSWSPQAWLRQVHPDDRSTLETAMAAARSGDAGRQRLELRHPHAGGWRWLETTLLVIERTAGGRPQRLLATLADVQARREAEERQLMSAGLFQHLHEGLVITDADLRVIDANPACTEILGVPRAELLGSVPAIMSPNPTDPLARQQRAAMWSGLKAEGFWRGELVERGADGEPQTLQATLSTVRGPLQDLRYHVLVLSDITEQRAQRDALQRQAHTDELTRLPNRARLTQLLDDALRAADRDGYLLVVCYLDLDRFKPVNDEHGHAAGDRLLAELAGRLRSALRSREHWADSAARLGGDEFVLLLRAGTLDEARQAVDRVLRVVAQPYVIDPDKDAVRVTASMGATIYPLDRSDADTLLRHADRAMYDAKQGGRNNVMFFDAEHRRRTEERTLAVGRVQEALDRDEFVLYYQPEVDMRSGRVLGVEALLRWEHPENGLTAPLQFLPLIEHTGLSSRVGDWVLASALEHLSQWRRSGLDIAVSVNISARHLQEPDFAQRLSELLARHAEPLAGHIELEIVESTAHVDIDAVSLLLERCRAIGVRLALDDFGTGYSHLTSLRQLPVDTLKIDRSFVTHMLDDAQDRAIVEGVIGLARTLGHRVIAEGVESPAQARTLLDLGCHIGQGTGIAAPMPASQIAPWVRGWRGMFGPGVAMPALPAEPTEPAEPAEPAEPGKPGKPGKPVTPSAAVEPGAADGEAATGPARLGA